VSWRPARLLAFLDELGISTRTVEHEAVFTVEEARALRGDLPGGHTKSLFLRDKKGMLALVTMPADERADLDGLARRIGSRRLSFASPRRLAAYLGVEPGSVSPFAVVNDPSGEVPVWLARELIGEDVVWLHPLVNTVSTAISPADLLRFLDAVDHSPGLLG